MGPMGSQSNPFPCTPLLHTSAMGFNDTGTLGGSQVERRRRENRCGVGGEGGGVCGGAVPLPRKFMTFSFQNGVMWCILGVLFLRFMCPTDCSCMINFIEVPVCA